MTPAEAHEANLEYSTHRARTQSTSIPVPPARTPAEFAAYHGLALDARRRESLDPVRPSAAIEAEYRRKLNHLIDEMHRSVLHWLGAAYRRNEPEIARLAQDDSPTSNLRRAVRRLARRWQSRFDRAAADLARHFATSVAARVDLALSRALRSGGFSVEFKRTAAMNDVLQAQVAENVSLIRSIPRQHFAQVEGMVMRSVQLGRDLGGLTDDLRGQFGVSKRRAALVARDQNNKGTAVVQKLRCQEAGITEAIWVHSAGGREPRPTHVRAGRERVRFNVAEGWYDPAEGRHVHPGELINCRCVSRPVVPGFS